MRRPFFVLQTLSLLGLTGCSWDPTFMPAGYRYHHNLYKAPPGPEARSIGYDYSPAANADVMRVWDLSAADLVDALERDTGLTPQPVYMPPVSGTGAFSAAFDNALRGELRTRGYTVGGVPSAGVPRLRTGIQPGAGGGSCEVFREFELSLSLEREGAAPARTARTYILPAYGHKSAQENSSLSTPRTAGKGISR
ncbi:MAG: hypothetical protein K9G62_08875 [Alphaproteobacteria bacterium]|nr:hypothetical protein [Alphaproteobacteria bacterium]